MFFQVEHMGRVTKSTETWLLHVSKLLHFKAIVLSKTFSIRTTLKLIGLFAKQMRSTCPSIIFRQCNVPDDNIAALLFQQPQCFELIELLRTQHGVLCFKITLFHFISARFKSLITSSCVVQNLNVFAPKEVSRSINGTLFIHSLVVPFPPLNLVLTLNVVLFRVSGTSSGGCTTVTPSSPITATAPPGESSPTPPPSSSPSASRETDTSIHSATTPLPCTGAKVRHQGPSLKKNPVFPFISQQVQFRTENLRFCLEALLVTLEIGREMQNANDKSQ